MPYSDDFFRPQIIEYVRARFPRPETEIVDVGAGSGTYGDLLSPLYPGIDASEIWEPYVERFNLASIYREVHVGDACTFDFSGYDLAILGDVLEHIEVERARTLLGKIAAQGCHAIVVVPFHCEQDEEEGNPFEKHLQDDLDRDTMEARYGDMLKLLHAPTDPSREYQTAVYVSREGSRPVTTN